MVDWGKVDVEEGVWVVHTVGGGVECVVERVERLEDCGKKVLMSRLFMALLLLEPEFRGVRGSMGSTLRGVLWPWFIAIRSCTGIPVKAAISISSSLATNP